MIPRNPKAVFEPERVYRHRCPYASLDMHVLSVIKLDDSEAKLRVCYVTRNSMRVQYLGVGDEYIETITLPKEQWDEWSLLH